MMLALRWSDGEDEPTLALSTRRNLTTPLQRFYADNRVDQMFHVYAQQVELDVSPLSLVL